MHKFKLCIKDSLVQIINYLIDGTVSFCNDQKPSLSIKQFNWSFSYN